MKKLILTNFQAPGDILMMTAAVRDLHLCHPNEFLTDVRTSCPELWENNPHVTALEDSDPSAVRMECGYPIIHRSNQTSYHFVNGFTDFLSEELGLRIKSSAFRGDIHLSSSERAAHSRVHDRIGEEIPYWIIVAGGKYDYTIKWWHFRRFQAVVDALRDEVLFVQVGEDGHHHPQLHGVLDLRGRTSTRDLILLTHRAEGVLCPVTFLMHLAAAVPDRNGFHGRPCVVVAGGRESPHWEAYPGHQFVHTVGALPCCREGGCWRSRTLPLGDGDEKDAPEHLCVDVRGHLPRCMDLIQPNDVVARIRFYLMGGIADTPDPARMQKIRPHLVPSLKNQIGGNA